MKNGLKHLIRDCVGPISSRALRMFIRFFEAEDGLLHASTIRALDKPYGQNRIIFECPECAIAHVLILPGQQTSEHFHSVRRELFGVRSGVLSFWQQDHEVSVLAPGDFAFSVPGVVHQLRNRGSIIVDFLEIIIPPLHLDKTRIFDPYGRIDL